MTNVLIDAANLHGGGAMQVASSFIDELAAISNDDSTLSRWPWLLDTVIEVTPAVYASLGPQARQLANLRVTTRRPYPSKAWLREKPEYDVSFVVFGPEYGRARARRRIIGCADVRSLYPSPPGESLSGGQRLRWLCRGMLSRWIFRRADYIVVETEAVKSQIVKLGIAHDSSVEVVSNSYNAVFDEPDSWQDSGLSRGEVDCDLLLAYVTRPYSHKNIRILEKVHESALSRHGRTLKFIVTLTEDEWMAQSDGFRKACVNAGALKVQQVPHIYTVADAAVFPSLLEAFSVMPLEAMRMNRVVFASDRDFVRSTCGAGAVYVDPLDADQIADIIINTMADPDAIYEHTCEGMSTVHSLPRARERAASYLDIIGSQTRAS